MVPARLDGSGGGRSGDIGAEMSGIACGSMPVEDEPATAHRSGKYVHRIEPDFADRARIPRQEAKVPVRLGRILPGMDGRVVVFLPVTACGDFVELSVA